MTLPRRYVVRRTLGEGGFGKVLLAHDSETDRKVAIKVLGAAMRDHPEVLRRFEREARLQARIEHPNLVRIYDHGLAGDEPYLVMEYVRGRDLERAVHRSGPLQAEAVLRLARELGAALDALHEAGILHRDLKPPNVMLSAQDGRAVVMDLGLAAAQEGTVLTRTGTALGTPRYMAPEMMGYGHAEEAADQWQMGAVLYFAATGEHLVPGGSVEEMVARSTEGRWRPWPEDHGLPAAFVAAIDRAASPEPEDRFHSCAAVAQAMAGEPAEPPPPAPPGPRRHRGALLAAGAVAVVVGYLGAIPEAPRPAPPSTPPVPSAAPPRTAGPFSRDFPRRVEVDLRVARSLWVSPEGEVVPEREAGDGEGWTPLVTEAIDPAFWGRALRHLPSLEEFYGWVAQGGLPGELPGALVGELRTLDGRFQKLGMPRPFHPYLYVEPAAGGWLAAAQRRVRDAEEAYRSYEEAVRAFLAGEPSELPAEELELAAPGVLLGWRIRGVRPDAYRLIEFHFERASRRVLHRWMVRETELLQEATWAAARSLREEPARGSEVVRALWEWQQLPSLFWFSPRLTLPVRVQLGGPARTPEEHALAGFLLGRGVYLDSRWEKAVGGQEAMRRAWSEALGEPAAGMPSRFRELLAMHALLSTLVLEVGDMGAAEELLREHGWLLERMPPLMRVEAVWDLAAVLRDPVRREAAPGSLRRRALEAVERLVATTPPEELPEGASRVRRERLGRELADGRLAARVAGG